MRQIITILGTATLVVAVSAAATAFAQEVPPTNSVNTPTSGGTNDVTNGVTNDVGGETGDDGATNHVTGNGDHGKGIGGKVSALAHGEREEGQRGLGKIVREMTPGHLAKESRDAAKTARDNAKAASENAKAARDTAKAARDTAKAARDNAKAARETASAAKSARPH